MAHGPTVGSVTMAMRHGQSSHGLWHKAAAGWEGVTVYDSLELEVGRTRQFVAGDQLHIAELIDGFDPWREPFVTMWKGLCDALVDGPIVIASSMPYECGWVRLLHQLANAGEFRCVPLELAGDGVVKVLLAPGVSPASWGWPSPYPLEPRPASDRALATGLDSASIGIAWLRDIGVLAK